jgi:prevent-host-death family protein
VSEVLTTQPPASYAPPVDSLRPSGRHLCLTGDAIRRMSAAEVSIRDLRNHGGEVVDRVERGEHLTITRAGRPVAELHPLARPPLSVELLIARRRQLVPVDPHRLRADIDALLEPGL